MSSTDRTSPSDTAGPEHGHGRSVPLLLAAAALVVVVVAAVLAFGIDRPPALPTLRDQPEPAPPAAVAWSSWRDGESCIHVSRPDGSVTEVRCDQRGDGLVGWTDDDRLLVVGHDPNMQVLEVDPDTGEVLDTRPVADDAARLEPPSPPSGDGVGSYHDDGELVVQLDGEELWRVEASDRYRIQASSVSPDGSSVAMTDSADRLLVVPTDGSAPPRIWAEDVQPWTMPVWEGQAPE